MMLEVLSAFSAKRACHVTIGSRRELKIYAVMKKAENILMIHKEESLVRRSFLFQWPT